MLANNYRCKELFSKNLLKIRKFTRLEISRLNISYPDFHYSATGTIEEYIEEYFSDFGKWGLTDKKGKIITPFVYRKIYDLKDGLARVFKESEGYGYINENGDELITCEYCNARDFHNGMAAVYNGKYWGFINKKGKLVIKCQYDEVSDFYTDLAEVKICAKWGLIDKNGKPIVECKYEMIQYLPNSFIIVKEKSKWGFLNKSGQKISEAQFIEFSRFSTSTVLVKNSGKQFFLLDENGDKVELFEFNYTKVWPFSYQEYGHYNLVKVIKNDKFGLIDLKCNEVVPCIYDSIGKFINGLAVVNSGGRAFECEEKVGGYQFIDSAGNIITQKSYDYVEDFSEGLGLVNLGCEFSHKINEEDDVMQGGKWGFINSEGKEVIPLIYDHANSFINGLARVSKNKLWGFIDKDGLEVIPIIYQYVSKFKDELCVIKLNEKWGVMNKAGVVKWDKKVK